MPSFHTVEASPEDAESMRDLHRDSVFQVGGAAYPAEILEAWAKPEGDAGSAGFRRFMTEGKEHFFLAYEADGTGPLLGFSGLVHGRSMVSAVYVRPTALRRGVGRALLAAVEARARALGLTELELWSSVNAVAFYTACGFTVLEHTSTRLRRGDDVEMTCVHMRRELG